MKSCMLATIGSPFASKGAVRTLPLEYCTIRTLLAGNTGEPGGTKAIPSGPPTFARRIADVMLYVPLPSGTKSQWYQPPLVYETIFILPAPGNPGGTKPIEPTELAKPNGVRSTTLSGAVLPGLLCSS